MSSSAWMSLRQQEEAVTWFLMQATCRTLAGLRSSPDAVHKLAKITRSKLSGSRYVHDIGASGPVSWCAGGGLSVFQSKSLDRIKLGKVCFHVSCFFRVRSFILLVLPGRGTRQNPSKNSSITSFDFGTSSFSAYVFLSSACVFLSFVCLILRGVSSILCLCVRKSLSEAKRERPKQLRGEESDGKVCLVSPWTLLRFHICDQAFSYLSTPYNWTSEECPIWKIKGWEPPARPCSDVESSSVV